MFSNFTKRLKQLDYSRIAYHVLFWLTINIVYDLFYSYLFGIKFVSSFFFDFIYFTPSQILLVYFTLYFLFPRFLYKKKYLLFGITFLVLIIFVVVLFSMPIQYSQYKLHIFEKQKVLAFFEYTQKYFIRTFNLNLMLVVIAGTIKLLKNWFHTQQQQNLLEKEKMEMNLRLQETEIKLLKAQINPDFLFSALDSLHQLSEKKSDIAPEVVIKISALLDYMLYESTLDFVIIDKEMENIVNYLYLQNIKPKNIGTISFDYQNPYPNTNIKPAILFPFIETIFRCANQSNIQNIKLDIQLNVDKHELSLIARRDLFREDIEKIKAVYSPIERILDIQYKENYTLKFDLSNEELEICLLIEL